jgi:hypothetical protein
MGVSATMTSDLDIYRTANTLLEQYGDGMMFDPVPLTPQEWGIDG